MSRTFGAQSFQLTVTKDQSEYLKTLLPRKYSLVQSKNKSQRNQMTIEELRFWESGGSYDIVPLNFEEFVKEEEDMEFKGSTEGVSSMEERERNEVCDDLICKIQDDVGVIEEVLEEELESESLFNPVQVLMEQEDESSEDYGDRSDSLIEPKRVQRGLTNPVITKKVPETKGDFVNGFNMVVAPSHLLPFIQKTGARRRQKPAKKRERVTLNPQVVPEPITLPAKTPEPAAVFVQPTPTLILPPPKPTSSKSSKTLTTQQKHYLYILEQVKQNKYDKLFQKPLSAADLEHLGYNLIEHKQLNLAIIETNIRSNIYQHLEQLHRDLLMVWLTSYSFKPAEPSPSTSVKVFDKSQLKSYLFDNQSNIIGKPPMSSSNSTNKVSLKQRQWAVDEIKNLSPQHLVGVWNIATQGTDQSKYDIVFDFQTMDDVIMEKLLKYIESVIDKEENRKEGKRMA